MPQLDMDMIIKLLGALTGVGTVFVSIITFIVKIYANKIKYALEALEDNGNAISKRAEEQHNKMLDRQRIIEIAYSEQKIQLQQLIRDVSRVEGGQEVIQKHLTETSEKVAMASGRIDAAFRFIDNAHRRATDVAAK